MAWLLSVVIRFALSRKREYLADAGSVELTKDPDAMISALRKIEGRGELEGATSAVMEMCIDNPREGFADLFATHPSIESRVTALVQFAGGHDPRPLDLPEETQDESSQQTAPEQPEAGAPGPWSSEAVPAVGAACHIGRPSSARYPRPLGSAAPKLSNKRRSRENLAFPGEYRGKCPAIPGGAIVYWTAHLPCFRPVVG